MKADNSGNKSFKKVRRCLFPKTSFTIFIFNLEKSLTLPLGQKICDVFAYNPHNVFFFDTLLSVININTLCIF